MVIEVARRYAKYQQYFFFRVADRFSVVRSAFRRGQRRRMWVTLEKERVIVLEIISYHIVPSYGLYSAQSSDQY